MDKSKERRLRAEALQERAGNHSRYVRSVLQYNQAAPLLDLRELPLDLPAYIARNPEHLRDLVRGIEAAVRPLQALLADMKVALADDGQGPGLKRLRDARDGV